MSRLQMAMSASAIATWAIVLLPTAPAAGAERGTGEAVADRGALAEIASRVDEVFAEYDTTRSPGCSLGVIRAGELVYTRGYGMASLDHGVPLGPRSVFRIASTSKQFTAFSIQLLVERGEIDLEADVRSYLPEQPEYDDPVTVRHLLNHTSGYRDYLDLSYLAGLREEDYYTDAEVLDFLTRQRELNFQPGTEYLYSNSGYFLLGQIVLRVTGKTLRRFAAEEIFDPLGMRQTHFHDDFQEIVPERAVGYSPTEEGGYRIDQTTLEMIGDGGVFTSVEDLARWDRNFYQPTVGSEATLERMLETGILADGERIDYASGLQVTDHQGLRKVAHSGGFVGYRAQMIRFPEQRLSVICLCNRGDASPSTLAQAVADLFLAEYLQRPAEGRDVVAATGVGVAIERLDALLGAYRRVDSLRVIRIEREPEGLVAIFSSDARSPIRPIGPDRFVGDVFGTPFEVVFSAGGATTYFGPDRTEGAYEKIELAQPSAESVAQLAGDYRCDELLTTIRVEAEGTNLRLGYENPHRNSPEVPFVPTLPDTFEADGQWIVVDRDAEGRPDAVRLAVGRVRDILCLPLG